MIEDKIKARIAELEHEREAFVAQANATIHAFNASIAELQKLITEPGTEYVAAVGNDPA